MVVPSSRSVFTEGGDLVEVLTVMETFATQCEVAHDYSAAGKIRGPGTLQSPLSSAFRFSPSLQHSLALPFK